MFQLVTGCWVKPDVLLINIHNYVMSKTTLESVLFWTYLIRNWLVDWHLFYLTMIKTISATTKHYIYFCYAYKSHNPIHPVVCGMFMNIDGKCNHFNRENHIINS